MNELLDGENPPAGGELKRLPSIDDFSTTKISTQSGVWCTYLIIDSLLTNCGDDH